MNEAYIEVKVDPALFCLLSLHLISTKHACPLALLTPKTRIGGSKPTCQSHKAALAAFL